MKKIHRSLLVVAAWGLLASVVSAQVMPVTQVSPVRLRVSKKQKTDSKETFRTSDGVYRSSQKNKEIRYTIDLMNVRGGAAREFVVRWSVLVQHDYSWIIVDGKRSNLRVIQGEKTFVLDFGK